MEPQKTNLIMAIVVLYRPDLNILDRLVKSAISQVDKILFIDNTPSPSTDIAFALKEKYGNNLYYQALGDNLGIAAAQNIGIKKALEDGCPHVLLLDQDSVIPPDMVVKLIKAESQLLQDGMQVAAVGPSFIHEKSRVVEKATRHTYLRIKWLDLDPSSDQPVVTDCLMSSGSLIRTSVLNAVGFMREDLFIDWVDCEWGLRAKYQNFKSYAVPNTVMEHHVGVTAIKFGTRWFYFHNDLRHYYIIRNETYLIGLKTMGWEWRICHLVNELPKKIIKYLVFSDHRIRTFFVLFRAVIDGFRGKLGRMDQVIS